MKAVIYHNPACGTSRKTLEILENSGVDLTVIKYLDTPYSRERLVELFDGAGISPRDALRLSGTDAEERGLDRASDDEILDAMVANPAYVNRPFVQTDKGIRFCRPQDKVREIL